MGPGTQDGEPKSVGDLVHGLWLRADARPLPPPPSAVELPFTDADPAESDDTLGDAEGQTFMIEYVDSSGKRSRRRITVWSITRARNGWPSLMARCHERRATRQFRVDRIVTCIDLNGEVHEDVPAFLHDAFGTLLRRAPAVGDGAPADTAWARIAIDAKAPMVLLAAMAGADGVTRSSEIAACVQAVALDLEWRGHQLSADDCARLERMIVRLRPTEAAITRAADELAGYDRAHSQRLLRAAVTVMESDGERHPAELEFLNTLARDLLGAPIL